MTVKVVIAIISSLGVLGTLLPGLPGTPLIVLAALVYGFNVGWQVISWQLIVGLILLSGLAELSEYLFSLLGVKYFGGSRYGILGAIAGLLISPFLLGPIGLVVGPLLGAVIVEWLTGREIKEAVQIGLGTILGQLGGSLVSLLISLVMTSWLLMTIF
ncbi:hypothetical protein JCM16358_21970 [Halanaerocella petrolearia]